LFASPAGLSCVASRSISSKPLAGQRERFIQRAELLRAKTLGLRGELQALENRVLVRELVAAWRWLFSRTWPRLQSRLLIGWDTRG
jgi:hypothetical protein